MGAGRLAEEHHALLEELRDPGAVGRQRRDADRLAERPGDATEIAELAVERVGRDAQELRRPGHEVVGQPGQRVGDQRAEVGRTQPGAGARPRRRCHDLRLARLALHREPRRFELQLGSDVFAGRFDGAARAGYPDPQGATVLRPEPVGLDHLETTQRTDPESGRDARPTHVGSPIVFRRNRIALVDDGRETSTRGVTTGRRGEFRERRLAVLPQDLSRGRVGRTIGARVLTRDSAVHLGVLRVVDLLAARDGRERVAPRDDGLRLERFHAARVAPARNALLGDHTLDVVVEVQFVDHASAVEPERTAIRRVRSAELQQLATGAIGRRVDRIDEGRGHRLHRAAATAVGDGRGSTRDADSLPRLHLHTAHTRTCVSADVDRGLFAQPDGDVGAVGLAQRRPAVEVLQDLRRRPALLGVPVCTPLAHATAVTVPVSDQDHAGVGHETDVGSRREAVARDDPSHQQRRGNGTDDRRRCSTTSTPRTRPGDERIRQSEFHGCPHLQRAVGQTLPIEACYRCD